MLYALFFDGRQISTAHSTREAVAVEAFERGAVERGAQDFAGDPASYTRPALAEGYEIRSVPCEVTATNRRNEQMTLFSEDYSAAKILDVVRRYCGGEDDLDSRSVQRSAPISGGPLAAPSCQPRLECQALADRRAELMHVCAEDGCLEITGEFGACITANITPEGVDVLEALDEEEADNGKQSSGLARRGARAMTICGLLV
jgi:hypothetical protein